MSHLEEEPFGLSNTRHSDSHIIWEVFNKRSREYKEPTVVGDSQMIAMLDEYIETDLERFNRNKALGKFFSKIYRYYEQSYSMVIKKQNKGDESNPIVVVNVSGKNGSRMQRYGSLQIPEYVYSMQNNVCRIDNEYWFSLNNGVALRRDSISRAEYLPFRIIPTREHLSFSLDENSVPFVRRLDERDYSMLDSVKLHIANGILRRGI